MHTGSCLCRAITFTVAGDLPPPDACHCTICRKSSGHYFASTDVKKSALTIDGAEKVTWFQSSPKVRRGFCAVCGSQLFFYPPHRDWIGVAMGAFDQPTGTHLSLHIFTVCAVTAPLISRVFAG